MTSKTGYFVHRWTGCYVGSLSYGQGRDIAFMDIPNASNGVVEGVDVVAILEPVSVMEAPTCVVRTELPPLNRRASLNYKEARWPTPHKFWTVPAQFPDSVHMEQRAGGNIARTAAQDWPRRREPALLLFLSFANDSVSPAQMSACRHQTLITWEAAPPLLDLF